jgi:DNA-binding PucR family transcriptional regulator
MLGPDAVALLSAPSTGVVGIGEPRIWDPLGVGELTRGDLVLGINVSSDCAASAVVEASAAGASAIALKGDATTLHAAISVATNHKIALLAVSPTVSWDQFYALVLSAATNVRPDDDEPTPMGDLFALANAMAAMIGAAVTIEDPRGRLLAYSNLDQPIDEARRDTILGRQNPSPWSRQLEKGGYYRQLSTVPDGVVRISDPTGRLRDRMATLIKAGAEVLGSIWVVEGIEPFGPEAESALRSATPLAAMHLLRQRTFNDSSRRDRGVVLRGLLEEGLGEVDYPGALGIDVDTPSTIVAFHLVTVDNDDVELSVSRSRVIDAITVACEAFRRRVVCTWIGQTIYALFPSTGRDSALRLASIAEDICSRFGDRLGVQLVAGISSTSDGLAGARDCRHEADRVVRVLRDTSIGRTVATIDEVRVPSILLTLADLTRTRADLRLPGIDRLIAHDAEHSKTYMQTLRAFIDASGNVSAVATSLNLHTNTVRYRVRRLGEISGLDLDDPSHRLVVAVDLLSRREND